MKMGFWENCDAALDKCEQAKTVQEVVDVLNQHFDKSAGDAFFGGSGGDRQLLDAIGKNPNGWRVFWAEAEYHWKARDTEGSILTYVEGDVYATVPTNGMTVAQIEKLKDLCWRYKVRFVVDHYQAREGSMMNGWVEAWVGGPDQAGNTIYVGVDRDGRSHS